MKKYLPEDDNPPQSSTLIAVHPNRLQEEYEHGRADQLKEEHSKKLTRIWMSLGVTSMILTSVFFGASTSILFLALIIQTLLHIFL